MNTYYDPHVRRHALKILPGEYVIGGQQDVIVTVLGSCVAACIRDVRRNIGGMNHFMLPLDRTWAAQFVDGFGEDERAARYGIHAMELLINELIKTGSRRQDLTAKAFGGGAVLGNMPSLNVGRSNGLFVRHFLNAEGIPLVAEDLFGELPRKIYFFPDSGDVRVKYLRSLENDTVATREQRYASSLILASDSTVELFT